MPICSLIHIKDLNLSHNIIRTIPSAISQLSRLTDIDLSANYLESYPHEFDQLTHLRQILLDHNLISAPVATPKGVFVGLSGNSFQEESSSPRSSPSRSISWAEMCGKRPEMQDSVFVAAEFRGMRDISLACVFDGHAGVQVAHFASIEIPKCLGLHIKEGGRDPSESFVAAFKEIQGLITAKKLPDGSAGCAALITTTEVVVANVGDSRCVLCRSGTAIPLSIDHKPDTASEIERIVQAGGFVTPAGRVNGELALSRSLGDCCFQPIVSSEPDVTRTPLQPDDMFVVLACDGIWDVLSSQQAVDIILQTKKPLDSAAALRDAAYLLGSGDNLSVVIIWLKEVM